MAEDRYARGLEVLDRLDPGAADRIQQGLGEIAPRLPQAMIEFVFGTVYAGEASLRDREIVAIAALAAQGGLGAQLKTHIGYALRLGVSPEEIVDLLVCVGVHAGFPAALNGLAVAKEAFTEGGDSAVP